MYSSLAYQKLNMTPSHYTDRRQRVNAVVIHYTASVVREAQDVVNYWQSNDPYSSSNYIIDVAGRISAVVDETKRPYTTGSWGKGEDDVDDRAITIECSCDNDKTYTVSGNTINSLINLLVDIGFRYGIYWKYTGDKTGNVHAHRWYQATPCPGDYLLGKFPMIVDMANFHLYKKEESSIDERLQDLEDVVETHTAPRYNSLDDIPEWARPEIKWLIDHHWLKGSDQGLQLSWDMLRTMVIMVRTEWDK